MTYDAIVVGAGFGGLDALRVLRDKLGFTVQVFERAPDVGGTWYWNKYPGCQCDIESFVYCYSFDKELLQQNTIGNRYLKQPEVLAYLKAVAKKYDLYKDIKFQTAVRRASFNEEKNTWDITTDAGERVSAKYLITATGAIAAAKVPEFKGLNRFKEWFHTSQWPKDTDVTGKRVGVIGTASSGAQVSTAIAPLVKQLKVFQRTPQYVAPAGNFVYTEQEAAHIKENYEAIWKEADESLVAAGFMEATAPASNFSSEEQQAMLETAWKYGSGFRFGFGVFSDVFINEATNKIVQDFMRRKTREVVKDPRIAEALCPTWNYAQRPICCDGYHEIFNRTNVELVNIRNAPIEEITENGIRTQDGVEHELDIIVLATGYDGASGSVQRVNIYGRDGKGITQAWADEPYSHLGLATKGYPNLFTLSGPNSPFTNIPPLAEVQVEWLAELLDTERARAAKTIEATESAQDAWTKRCVEIQEATLFATGGSWFTGANIPGKKVTSYFYLGGFKPYKVALKEEVEAGYPGFTFS